MPVWIGPIYKKLADSELGAGHTSGIVPTTGTQKFFGEPLIEGTHSIKSIVVELWYGDKSVIIKTNVTYFLTKTHRGQIHITGNIMPAYKNLGAKTGDVMLFWKSSEDNNMFKAELVKRDTERWNELSQHFTSIGGEFDLDPPWTELALQEDEEKYQEEAEVDSTLTKSDFPPVKRLPMKQSKIRVLPPRSKAKGDFILKNSKYMCEVNKNHSTFITKSGSQYMEKHHLIPLEFYENFEYNLDDITNIVSICPLCHRIIHYGKKEESEKIIEHLWNIRKNDLKTANLFIELDELKRMYF